GTRDERGVRQFPRVLSLLPGRAPQPHLPAAAFRRHEFRHRLHRAGDQERESLVAAGGAGFWLRLRLGRAFLLREEPPGHLQAPFLFLRRRLGDVQGHPARQDSVLALGFDGVRVAGPRLGTIGDMDVADEPTWTYSRRVPKRGPAARTPARNWHQSRKISHAAATISAKPAQWFHFSGSPRYQTEKPANTSRVMTSCMPFSCGAL